MGEIREPKKITSIEKKNKIIRSGLECFCKNGYYNTTTPEIAKAAGVSTGIIYSYFKDKKDIFIKSLDLYFAKLCNPIIEKLNNADFGDIKKTIAEVIDMTIDSHKEHKIAHEEMIAMSHLDEDIHNKFIEQEEVVINKISEILKNKGISLVNPNEKIHIAYNLIQNLCHEYVFHRHDFIEYSNMINLTANIIENLLQSN